MTIRFPVTCPECGREQLVEYLLAVLEHSLEECAPIRLVARCHDSAWDASALEVEQIRAYMAVYGIEIVGL